MNGINCERRIYVDKFNTHSHSFAQLILPLYGMLYIETNYKELMLDDEHLFLLPPDCEHTFKADKRNEFLVLDIPHHMVTKHDMEKILGGAKFLFDDKWKAIRFLLLNEIDGKKGSSSINSLFHYFYQMIANDNTADSVKYINENFAEEIDLETLARIEHYNINYYSEWFKKTMKVSPKEYIQKLRVEKAKELLINSDFTILHIAQMVGYRHNSSLTRIFKELEKITPAEFRRRI